MNNLLPQQANVRGEKWPRLLRWLALPEQIRNRVLLVAIFPDNSRPTLRAPDEKPADIQAKTDALCERLTKNNPRLKSAFRR